MAELVSGMTDGVEMSVLLPHERHSRWLRSTTSTLGFVIDGELWHGIECTLECD